MTSFCVYSQTKSWAEFESKFLIEKETEIKPKISILIVENSNSTIGYYAFALVNNRWAQSYSGILINYKNSTFNLGIGLETDKNPMRYNIGHQFKKAKFLFYQNYEYGGSGFWYNIKLDYLLRENVFVGIFSRRYYGIGPKIEVFLLNKKLSFWISPLYDFESKKYSAVFCLKHFFSN